MVQDIRENYMKKDDNGAQWLRKLNLNDKISKILNFFFFNLNCLKKHGIIIFLNKKKHVLQLL